MRKFILLFLASFFITSAFAQQRDGVIKVRKKLNNTPMIAGIAGGEIEGALLCAGEGIVINKNIKVISFVLKVDQGSKEVTIKHNGNKLNKEACDLIALLSKGSEIFINEIAVQDNKGQESLTTPMRFRIK